MSYEDSKATPRGIRLRDTQPDPQGKPQRPRKQVSPAQLAANQRNSLLSSGPRTRRGKQVSSKNAGEYFLTGQFTFLDDDDPGRFETFLESLQAERPRACIDCRARLELNAEDYFMLARVSRIRSGILVRHQTEIVLERARSRARSYEHSSAETKLAELLQDDLVVTDEQKRKLAIDQVTAAREALQSDDLLLASAYVVDVNGPNQLATLERYATTFSRRIEKRLKAMDDCCPKMRSGGRNGKK